MQTPIKETPRRRIYRLAEQLAHWKCYGYTRICTEQDICVICEHCAPFYDGYNGADEWDCHMGGPANTDQEPILHCRKFKAVKEWKYASETFLIKAMGDIIQDMCKRETERVKPLIHVNYDKHETSIHKSNGEVDKY